MNEAFLQYLWRYKLIKSHGLKSTSGDTIDILSFGHINNDAGPDFTNCKIKINDTIWAGNVEVHVKASDWYKHGHHTDKKYDNIILHVVFQNDSTAKRNNGEDIVTLGLEGLYDDILFSNYKKLIKSKQWVPCMAYLASMDESLLNIWKEKLIIERLKNKTELINDLLILYKNDWQRTFYVFLFRNFGFKVNAVPFELLAKSIPQHVLDKHKDNLLHIEALLFGQAGLLPAHINTSYAQSLSNEYKFLKQKFSLRPIDGSLWRLSKMWPSGFPHIRIAQLGQLLYKSSFLFSRVMEASSVKELRDMLQVKAGTYWNTHYTFENENPYKIKRLGSDAVNNLLINTFIPFIFVHAQINDNERRKALALDFLRGLQTEKNSIVRHWEKAGLKSDSAYDSQALIELKNSYCKNKRCLHCMIGDFILRRQE